MHFFWDYIVLYYAYFIILNGVEIFEMFDNGCDVYKDFIDKASVAFQRSVHTCTYNHVTAIFVFFSLVAIIPLLLIDCLYL